MRCERAPAAACEGDASPEGKQGRSVGGISLGSVPMRSSKEGCGGWDVYHVMRPMAKFEVC